MRKNRIKAELWDKFHYQMRQYWDGMSHNVIYYNGRPDLKVMTEAITYVFEKIPVLRASYIDRPIRPYWRVNEFNIDDAFSVVESDDLKAEAEKFLSGKVEADGPVQLRCRVIVGSDKFAFCSLMNHMCADGGDYKYVMLMLCETYNCILSGEELPEIKNGSRSHKEMYSGLSGEQVKKAKRLFKNVSATKNTLCLPFTKESSDDRPIFIERILSAECFAGLRKQSKADGVTVNSVLQGAFSRALYKFTGGKKDDGLQISCMRDLRPSMKSYGLDTGITNHTGFLTCIFDRKAESIDEAVRLADDSMNLQKNDPFLGMYGIPILNLLYTILPKFISSIIIRKVYKSPLFSVSNMGYIDSCVGILGDLVPYDCFLTGTVKYKPAIQLSTFTLDDLIHITFAIKGNEADKKLVHKLADTMVDELHEYARLHKMSEAECAL